VIVLHERYEATGHLKAWTRNRHCISCGKGKDCKPSESCLETKHFDRYKHIIERQRFRQRFGSAGGKGHPAVFQSGRGYGKGRGGTRYSSLDIFGETISTWYEPENPKEFVESLVRKFYAKNPDPSPEIRRAFTRLLHQHNLHWEGEGVEPNRKRIPKDVLDIIHKLEASQVHSS
jgi:hypothetical protein